MAKKQSKKPISFAHHNPRIAEIRRQKKAKRARVLITFILSVVLVFCYFLGLFERVLSSVGEFANTVTYYFMSPQEFPVNVPIVNVSKAQKITSSFAVLGDSELIIYNNTGNILRRVPHGFNTPIMSTSDTRVCLYSIGDDEITVHARDKTLFSHTFDTAVLNATMSESGKLAVFTQNSLEIFNEAYESIWKWSDVSEIPLALSFDSNNKNFAVALLNSQNGMLTTDIHFYATNSSERLASIENSEGIPIKMQYINRGLLIVYDTFTAYYNKNTGEEIARYNYDEKIFQSASVNENGEIALLFGDSNYPEITQIVVLNENLESVASEFIGQTASAIDYIERNIYIYLHSSILVYDENAMFVQEVKTEQTPVQLIKSNNLLLLLQNSIDYFNSESN